MEKKLTIDNSQLTIKKGYKNTEVGVIPEDWEVETLEDMTYRIGDGIHTTPKYSNEGEYYFVNGNNLLNGKIAINDNTKRVSKDEFAIHQRDLNNSTVLISINGTIGNIAFYSGENIVLGKSAAYLNLSKKVDKNLIYQVLQTEFISRFFDNELTGSTIKNLGLTSIRNTPIPLPPTKAEQTAIATALSDADALINSLSTLIAKKRNIKQGAMQKLLNPDFKDLHDVHDSSKSGNQDNHKNQGSDKWEVKKLGEIAEIYTGKKNNQDKVENGQYPFFVRSQTVERINSYSYDGEAILIPGEGNIGKIFHYINGKFDYHQRVYKISDFQAGYFGKYIYRYLSEYFGRHAMENSVKATVDSLRLPTFQVFEIPFPPTMEEQVEIATILSDMDAEIQSLETKLEKYKEIKLGMMQNLLTGKIRLV